MILKVKKLTPDAILPSYSHPGDAGINMFANETVTIEPGQAVKIKSGIAMEIPEGYVGLMWDRSGLSTNHRLKSLGGVIDSSYRGESLYGLINLGTEPYTVEKGHKVVQMLIQKVESVEIVEVDTLPDTSRGEGGFGSTGK
jgi:dUTP pyrophosphatase